MFIPIASRARSHYLYIYNTVSISSREAFHSDIVKESDIYRAPPGFCARSHKHIYTGIKMDMFTYSDVEKKISRRHGRLAWYLQIDMF